MLKPQHETLAQARARWAHDLQSAFPKDREYMQRWRLYHVVLQGPMGFNYDGYIPAPTAERARLCAIEMATSLKGNDFNSEAEEA